ncbi:MAG TPA: histidinol dehydrogenase [Elusimicrobia bacterium]|nr:MAG: histidinol dehydrogenase [Elusimicrobia bacterium RIFOXYA12_FULL_49_49]OGS09246.1 MAG: histidinol dehydrogenase [Elusimicrobia bacterium RIFOXYA1_FULL_47_7]OGS16851.1 MAG: histidinol dehydrogenase [Elusimicrobia bacterium RIFOXYA2_FULL_47_53]OGS32079.1 MAG: histidinol dehydrogenase [Elusimicrobia bacterium RIFOXYB2_FULL_46_23]HBU69972.1 histidinol dehydrogenase [Elusimicrobiota bacterium]
MKNTAAQVSSIIKRVLKDGDSAVSYFTAKFDGKNIKPSSFRVSKTLVDAMASRISPDLAKALKKAAQNITRFHKEEFSRLPKSWRINIAGTATGFIYKPVETAGLYVPGGKYYSYPSTVLMTAIPARIAGVKRIIMATPPKNLTPAVLFAAKICGVDEIYAVNGPASIAAMAYGTKTIPKVDIIVGPGNAYINEAKRQILDVCGIDSLAGPSEVAIIADRYANPEHIAADLLAQAEHDSMAKAYLFCESDEIIATVRVLLSGENTKQITIFKSSVPEAVKRVNEIAPEHLEIMTANPETIVKKIQNAGAVFVGGNTPTAAGDYIAGPSHVLPTNGTARFSGGLSCATFIKKISYISAGKRRLSGRKDIVAIAAAEGLSFHALSAKIRQ